jgi:hypothetical protein
MAVNKPIRDNARKGAVKKRTPLKDKMMGTAWTKRDKILPPIRWSTIVQVRDLDERQ